MGDEPPDGVLTVQVGPEGAMGVLTGAGAGAETGVLMGDEPPDGVLTVQVGPEGATGVLTGARVGLGADGFSGGEGLAQVDAGPPQPHGMLTCQTKGAQMLMAMAPCKPAW